jgi:RIO-like serine/threonine protein kinase
MDDYKLIEVTLDSNKKLNIKNPTSFTSVGKGGQGAVFKIDDYRCIKVYYDFDIALAEQNAYLKTLGSPIMPKLYETGDKYIIIEYIGTKNLKDYLMEKGSISEKITQELVNMFSEMKRLNFLRRDESLRHILLNEDEKIKIVDHVYAFTLDNPMPVKMFKQLNEIGMLKDFIEQGKNQDSTLFKEFSEKMPEYFSN